jgi:hypothetical protein
MIAFRFLPLLLAISAVACGGGTAEPPPPEQPSAVTFVFRLRGHPSTEEFRVSSSSPSFISQVRAQLLLPESQRLLFVGGPIQAGDGGHNVGWSWHYSSARLIEVSMELCDGTPSMVEANLNYWLNTVMSFCPWSSYAYAELG